MIAPFGFAAAGEIAFGSGARARLGAAARGLGARAFLVTGRNPDRAGWAAEALRVAGCAVAVHATPGEPTVADARAAVAAARDFGADLVVAVGGGAALDLGKATAGLLRAADPMDHLEVVGRGLPLVDAPVPVIAVPTTAGTGSEVTRNAVLGAPEHGRKVSLRDIRLLPRLALVDPDLLEGLPHAVALASGLDALVQVIEPYLSRMANPMTDALCRDAIPRGLRALPRLLAGAAEARADMAFVSLCGGLALANAKLGAIHGLSGVIGGRTGAAHGALCGRLAPAVLAATEAALPAGHPAAVRCAEVRGWIAAALGGRPQDGWEALRGFVDAQGLPSLAAMGVAAAEMDAIAAEALRASSTQGAPQPPDAAMLAAALRAA
jgi:alcohol dehydrogenase class IV